MKQRLLTIMAVVFALGAGCMDPAEFEDLETDEVEEITPKIVAVPNIPLFNQNGNEVPVCFLTPGLANEREIFRTALNESWGKVSPLRFTGFGTCGANIPPRSVPVRFVIINPKPNDPTYNPENDWGGWSAVGMGGRLGDHVAQIEIRLTPQRARLRDVIIHEMGHTLGLAHEQQREGANRCPEVAHGSACNSNAQCTGFHEVCDFGVHSGSWTHPGRCVNDQSTVLLGGLIQTPYDGESIMNYCRASSGTTLPLDALSPWDIVGIQRLYGLKPLGSIVGVQNRCIDIDNPSWSSPTSATRLQAWQCVGNGNQKWNWGRNNLITASQYTASHSHVNPDGSFYVHSHDAYANMDVQWANSANGTPIWNYTYTGTNAQKWKLENVAIVGEGDLCLESTSLNAGAAVKVARCSTGFSMSTFAQKWTLNWVQVRSGEFYQDALQIKKEVTSNLCLAATGTSGLTLATCNSNDNRQAFYFNRRQINSLAGGCLDVINGWATNGQAVQRYTCRSTLPENRPSDNLAWAQMWHVRGNIRGLSNKCVDVDVSSAVQDGSQVQLWTCGSQANQVWDFHL